MTRLVTAVNVSARVGKIVIVQRASFWVDSGEVVAIVGPSGAGKTTLASLVINEPSPGVSFDGDVTIRRDSSHAVGYLPQDAGMTLNPSRRIGAALGDLVRIHRPEACRMGRHGARDAVLAVLSEAAYPVEGDPDAFLARYPWQFSGGQRQRLALAQVLTMSPQLLVLDEPTAGLDSLARSRVIDQIRAQRARGLGVLLITHDRFLARAVSDRVYEMQDGVLDHQIDPEDLAEAEPVAKAGGATQAVPRLRVRDLHVRLGGRVVLDSVDFDIGVGEMVAVMGRSGAGKSTIARCLAGFIKPGKGTIQLDGRELPGIYRRSASQKGDVQYVWQEASSSFDPFRPVLAQCMAGGINLRAMARTQAEAYALELLAGVGLSGTQVARPPSGLSGGQLRRAALVRALMSTPRVLICDEVTTGLDPDIAESVSAMIDDWRITYDASVVMITHSLQSTIARADRLLVVDQGQIVWQGNMLQAAASDHPMVRLLRDSDHLPGGR